MHVDKKGIIKSAMERRKEVHHIDPKAGDADLWIKNWEELLFLTSREIVVEVEHAKAHSTEKDMSHFERFVTDGNEKADEKVRCWMKGSWHR